MINVTVWLAFIAGFLSFVSPCVLPLVPAYVGYMGNRVTAKAIVGANANEARTTAEIVRKHRFQMALHGIAFVVGFTFVFVVFGLAVTAGTRLLSSAVYDLQRVIIPRVGGILIILFGLHFIGVLGMVLRWLECRAGLERLGSTGFRIKHGLSWLHGLLYADTRPQLVLSRDYGLLSSSLMGIIFAAGWTPCIGPIYGTILTMAINNKNIFQAGGLMAMYSLGLGIPFIITALALDQTQGLLRRFKRHLGMLKYMSGVMMIVIGVLVFTGELQRISQFGAANALFSYQLEVCATQFFDGTLPLSEVGNCLSRQ